MTDVSKQSFMCCVAACSYDVVLNELKVHNTKPRKVVQHLPPLAPAGADSGEVGWIGCLLYEF